MEKLKRDFSQFTKAANSMIATNAHSYERFYRQSAKKFHYTTDEIQEILSNGSLEAKISLSRDAYATDGYYKQIVLYYATLLKYVGILIPNPSFGSSLSSSQIQKRYNKAIDYIEKMNLSVFCTDCALAAISDGIYYGIIIKADKKEFTVMNLPAKYCRSRFKDLFGNDIIEFNLQYFDEIVDEEKRKEALSVFPKEISKAYRSLKKSKKAFNDYWYYIPTEIGICFPLFDGVPPFLGVILASKKYDKAIEDIQNAAAEKPRKIIVQHMPHLQTGELLFEPDEAAEIHKATVQMMAGDPNVNVLTSYGDVTIEDSDGSLENADDVLNKIEENIFAAAGVSSLLFSPTGAGALNQAVQNDISLMMYFGTKIAIFVSNTVNRLFGNSSLTFKYSFLPVSYYNDTEYVENTFKLTGLGYSILLTAIAMDLNQKELLNIKDLENKILKLPEKLIPLNSSYTQSSGSKEKEEEKEEEDGATTAKQPEDPNADKGGRPTVEVTKKKETTITKDESISNSGR